MPKIEKETIRAIEWLAAEYKFLLKLLLDLHLIEGNTDIFQQLKAYKKAKRLLRYIGRCERKAEYYLDLIEELIENSPHLLNLEKELSVSRNELIKSFSLYAGEFKEELEELLTILQQKKEWQKKGLQQEIDQAQQTLMIKLQHIEDQVNTLITWIQSLEGLLQRLKEAEIKEFRKSRRGFLQKGLQAAGSTVGVSLLARLLRPSLAQAAAISFVNHYSPWNNSRPVRASTDFIILHTTEGSDSSSLQKLTRYGEANYMVGTDGIVYRIIDHQKIAKHAGRSMWGNKRNIDNISVGIEVAGYHHQKPTAKQISALAELLRQLKAMYKIGDNHVLTHSMVAYGTPNRWHRKSHRGRKRCGMLMGTVEIRKELGLSNKPKRDPDIDAKRLIVADGELFNILFPEYVGKLSVKPELVKIPPRAIEESEGFRTIGVDGDTAWSIAGEEVSSKSTIYFFPDGIVNRGDELPQKRLNALPKGTKVLVGYIYGGHITPDRSAFSVCGRKWNYPSTFYRVSLGPGKWIIKSGDELDENSIPRDTLVFFRN